MRVLSKGATLMLFANLLNEAVEHRDVGNITSRQYSESKDYVNVL